MLQVMNHLLTQPPGWSDYEERVGVVGVPFQVLYDWPMGTASGYAVFQDPEVNALLKRVLNVWGEYLTSPQSRVCLGKEKCDWFGPTGLKALEDCVIAADPPSPEVKPHLTFEKIFHCNPNLDYYGYKSWDDFFTRKFRFQNGIRPIASPEDSSIITNACESRPYKVATNILAQDKFWAKGQPYSIGDILSHDPLSSHFVGGTIYQAFLSSLSYHRWHAPVSGTIVKTKIINGTYFSEAPFTGWAGKAGLDVEGQITGQGYLSAMATRALIFIQADNVDVGLMCVVPIGMVEVSTCEVTVREGEWVRKGDELGMFHFGA